MMRMVLACSSWAAVLDKRKSLNYPADVYLERTDQHRGWFQSSLLTSIATKGQVPYRGVITHGFVLDERGLKMSKSLGNAVDPRMVIEGGKNQKENPPYSADVLRLWVSSVDYTGDMLIGPQVLCQMSDIYRKLRGTLRFLLANLHDWKADYTVPYSDLPMIDQHALFQLANVVNNIRESYDSYQFFKIFQLGKTKVFLRAGQIGILDSRRSEILDLSAKKIQSRLRTFLARRDFISNRMAAIHLQSFYSVLPHHDTLSRIVHGCLISTIEICVPTVVAIVWFACMLLHISVDQKGMMLLSPYS